MIDRNLSTLNETELEKDNPIAVVFIQLDLWDIVGDAQEYVRLCSGRRDLPINGDTFTATGALLSIGQITESTDFTAESFVVELSGADNESISHVKDFRYQNRFATMWLGHINPTDGDLVDTPYVMFVGRMDNMIITTGEKRSTITLHVEDRMIRGYHPLNTKYTDQDQKARFAGDLGLEFINTLIDRKIDWGRESDSKSENAGEGLSSQVVNHLLHR